MSAFSRAYAEQRARAAEAETTIQVAYDALTNPNSDRAVATEILRVALLRREQRWGRA